MPRRLSLTLLLAPILLAQNAQQPQISSAAQSQIPQGKVTQHSWTSKIFPGTVRDYWVYVPQQYKPDKPACLLVLQDGGARLKDWRVPAVLDELIHRGEIPVMVAVFVNPGVLPAQNAQQRPRYNRSFEYDALGDRYARFLIDELLPEVRKIANISADPNDRAIAGSSSGAIAAFTAAWNRPDAFRRVYSTIGSYVNLRGGHVYSGFVRKFEPKPLRIFLQDGSSDLDIYSGSWWMANQDLASALKYAGYDVRFETGTGGHDQVQGSALFPEAMRWLWRDYPKPIQKSVKGGERHFVTEFLEPGQEWELLSEGHRFTEGPAIDKDGTLYFTDIPNKRIHRLTTDGKVSVFKEDSGDANGLMFGPDGRLYACQNGRKRIVAYDKAGAETVIAEGFGSNDLVINAKGEIYVTEPNAKKIWFIDTQGKARVVHEGGLEFANGVMLSPDQSLLTVADSRSRWVWSFQIQADGSLANGQPFYHLETADESSATVADGMAMDTEGHLYVTTAIGLQICDQPGRVVAILDKPAARLSNVKFGGPDMKTLYVTAGDKVFKRRIRRTGASHLTPTPPPRPQL